MPLKLSQFFFCVLFLSSGSLGLKIKPPPPPSLLCIGWRTPGLFLSSNRELGDGVEAVDYLFTSTGSKNTIKQIWTQRRERLALKLSFS
jgi:hypothetical protein